MNTEKKQYLNIEAIKTFMQIQNISEKDLAKKLKTKLLTIKRFLNGEDQKHIKASFVYNLSIALEIPVHILVNREYKDMI